MPARSLQLLSGGPGAVKAVEDVQMIAEVDGSDRELEMRLRAVPDRVGVKGPPEWRKVQEFESHGTAGEEEHPEDNVAVWRAFVELRVENNGIRLKKQRTQGTRK